MPGEIEVTISLPLEDDLRLGVTEATCEGTLEDRCVLVAVEGFGEDGQVSVGQPDRSTEWRMPVG